MSGVNRWLGIGNLGQDPVVKSTPSGDSVCNFSIGCNESWVGKDGNKQERVEWVSIVAWRKLADLCGKYLAKGRQCYVEGKLQTRSWDKDGVKHYKTEVVADKVVFLGGGQVDKKRDEAPPPADQDVPY